MSRLLKHQPRSARLLDASKGFLKMFHFKKTAGSQPLWRLFWSLFCPHRKATRRRLEQPNDTKNLARKQSRDDPHEALFSPSVSFADSSLIRGSLHAVRISGSWQKDGNPSASLYTREAFFAGRLKQFLMSPPLFS